MALSNPYSGDRLPGHVGTPLPGVKAAILSLDHEKPTILDLHDKEGELLIRSDSMFDRYLNSEEDTQNAFVEIDGVKWFKTGDCVIKRKSGSK